MSKIASLVAACALSLSTTVAHSAPGVLPGNGIRVDASGRDKDVVQLTDAQTRATLARDRIEGEPVRDSFVSPDGTVVAVRHGVDDGGDSLAVYAIVRAVDRASGAKTANVVQVLDYRPRDGALNVSLQQVPNGTVVQVQTGRHPPLWRKVFFYESASRTWYEWPRALAPGDPTDGMPTTVGKTKTTNPYDAWLRSPDPQGD